MFIEQPMILPWIFFNRINEYFSLCSQELSNLSPGAQGCAVGPPAGGSGLSTPFLQDPGVKPSLPLQLMGKRRRRAEHIPSHAEVLGLLPHEPGSGLRKNPPPWAAPAARSKAAQGKSQPALPAQGLPGSGTRPHPLPPIVVPPAAGD